MSKHQLAYRIYKSGRKARCIILPKRTHTQQIISLDSFEEDGGLLQFHSYAMNGSPSQYTYKLMTLTEKLECIKDIFVDKDYIQVEYMSFSSDKIFKNDILSTKDLRNLKLEKIENRR